MPFLNLFISQCQSVQGEWMDVNDTLTHGFLWEKSAQRVTDGILIYPEIFLTKTKEGEKVESFIMVNKKEHVVLRFRLL